MHAAGVQVTPSEANGDRHVDACLVHAQNEIIGGRESRLGVRVHGGEGTVIEMQFPFDLEGGREDVSVAVDDHETMIAGYC